MLTWHHCSVNDSNISGRSYGQSDMASNTDQEGIQYTLLISKLLVL